MGIQVAQTEDHHRLSFSLEMPIKGTYTQKVIFFLRSNGTRFASDILAFAGKDNDYATANGYLYHDGHWYILDKLHSSTDGYHVAETSGINANGVILASATLNGDSTLYGVQLVPSSCRKTRS